MKSAYRVFWPLSIVVMLAVLLLQRGGVTTANPLSDQSVQRWLSLSDR
jgi:hypothetical protein